MDQIESRRISSIEKTQQRDRWTLEEDNLLRQTIKKCGTSWCQVAQSFPNRNPNSCIQRWKRLKGKNKKKKVKWTLSEDNLLSKLVQTQGKRWNEISKNFIGKTNKQCMERYNNSLNPNLNKNPFTAEEDEFIYQNYISIGSKWSQIALQLNGRTQNQVKNRFYSCILTSHLDVQNPYYTKLSSEQAKEILTKARQEHKGKLLLENVNLNKEFEQSQLNFMACDSQSFQVEDDDFYSNFHTLA
ncbi:unnamed protein product [Paramecium sonneborni]|uniref:Myb-like DNA-binding domain containing protein n=1 Tax=Paramecium sonneborni TaxID=65129 RepID=A0A8S1NHS2_9CILI|nr:unnamed protein product [Paramecium sonneborni]